jgi:hypothetical protein
VVALGNLHGYPLNQLPEFTSSYFAANTHILHILSESLTVSIILMYLACVWFISDRSDTRG